MTEWMTHWKRIKREHFELRYFILHKESSVTVISNYIWQTKKSYACEIVGEGQAHSYWSFTSYNRTQDNEPPSRNKGPLNSKICVIPPPSTQRCTQNRPKGKRRQASTEHRCWSITQKNASEALVQGHPLCHPTWSRTVALSLPTVHEVLSSFHSTLAKIRT